jgi:hypothetical protein
MISTRLREMAEIRWCFLVLFGYFLFLEVSFLIQGLEPYYKIGPFVFLKTSAIHKSFKKENFLAKLLIE